MAYTNHLGFGCWDLHNLGLLNADISYMENSEPSMMLPSEDNYSTGYLEDALIEFSIRFKRRRLNYDEYDHQNNYASTLDELGYWTNWSENYSMQTEEDFSHANLPTHEMHYGPGITTETTSTKETFFPELKTLDLEQEAISSTPKIMEEKNNYCTGLGIAHYNYNSDTNSTDSSSISDEREKMSKRKAMNMMTTSRATTTTKKKMVYPFGLVKPGCEEGDITLKDINKRILMPPSRPLRHPVGDFACRPVWSPTAPASPARPWSPSPESTPKGGAPSLSLGPRAKNKSTVNRSARQQPPAL